MNEVLGCHHDVSWNSLFKANCRLLWWCAFGVTCLAIPCFLLFCVCVKKSAFCLKKQKPNIGAGYVCVSVFENWKAEGALAYMVILNEANLCSMYVCILAGALRWRQLECCFSTSNQMRLHSWQGLGQIEEPCLFPQDTSDSTVPNWLSCGALLEKYNDSHAQVFCLSKDYSQPQRADYWLSLNHRVSCSLLLHCCWTQSLYRCLVVLADTD